MGRAGARVARGGANLHTAQYVLSGAERPEASGEKSCKEECGEEETSLGRKWACDVARHVNSLPHILHFP